MRLERSRNTYSTPFEARGLDRTAYPRSERDRVFRSLGVVPSFLNVVESTSPVIEYVYRVFVAIGVGEDPSEEEHITQSFYKTIH